jgi:excisionase family DNA binding protein
VEDRLLYRVTEVAVFLNVSRSKVYELLASGALRSVKIDRTRLVRRSDGLLGTCIWPSSPWGAHTAEREPART